jgi:hypothetical protein
VKTGVVWWEGGGQVQAQQPYFRKARNETPKRGQLQVQQLKNSPKIANKTVKQSPQNFIAIQTKNKFSSSKSRKSRSHSSKFNKESSLSYPVK